MTLQRRIRRRAPPQGALADQDTKDEASRVIARYGSEIDILRGNGTPIRVQLRRRVDDVVCGDQVYCEEGSRIVAQRAERKNQLTRRDNFNRHRTIAANIDRVWVVVAPHPEIPRQLIDRFLIGILNLPAHPGLVINKYDVIDAATEQALETLLANYRKLDLPVLRVSARTGLGLEALRAASAGGSNILVGPSGVGKSSLIQALLPRESLRVGDLGTTGEGRHTTTTARWYPAEGQAAWIDSPGVRDFSPEINTVDELARGFPDLAEHADHCRFRNCSHRAEPGCAVRAAVAHGEVPAARLAAWVEFLSVVEDLPRGR